VKRHSPIARIFIGASLIVFLTLSGCGAGKQAKIAPSSTVTATQPEDTATPEPTLPPAQTQTPSPTMAPTATLTPTQEQATPTPAATLDAGAVAQYFRAAFANLLKAYPYRLNETSQGASPLERVTDYAALDRVHASWTQDGQSFETITIG